MRRAVLLVAAMAMAMVVASGVAWAATIVGTNGDDTRNGTNNRDFMYGLNGDDVLRGRDGNDVIEGGGGADVLRGQPGNDTVSGGPGVDELYLGTSPTVGQDEASAGPGADFVDADNGTFDEVSAGSGDDFISADDGISDIVDCGTYASPTDSTPDFDFVDSDGTDILTDCESVF
jgi:RTX calcium-binding nonapeptide repeat (4 copies)